MLKVMLVDDEPFILQGLRVLINWREHGAEIVYSAQNGISACRYLENHSVDLIISDIRMPEMTGLELLSKIRRDSLSDAYFVILSGFADFSYVQQAMRDNCTDYILKPVDAKELLRVLETVQGLCDSQNEKRIRDKKLEAAYLQTNLKALIHGKFVDANLNYVRDHLQSTTDVCYVEVTPFHAEGVDEASDDVLQARQRQIYEASKDFLKEDSGYCIYDVSGQERVYDVGLICPENMWKKKESTQQDFLQQYLAFVKGACGFPVILLVGKKENDICHIDVSYGNIRILRSIIGFRNRKSIYYYEKEVQYNSGGIVLCKNSMDALIRSIEQNEHYEIRHSIDDFYNEMARLELTPDGMNLNINYLLFQLIHLATQQDDGINQEEILRNISESSFGEGIMRGSKEHLIRCAYEYGDYLSQLRQKVSRGVLGEIEKEIEKHYPENLTLVELAKKYYVNNAYLGQIFRKKYGCSFRDYLNNYRIEQAAHMLLNTDKPVYQIAGETGYKDVDYFVNRFIATKGCTPSRFRKKANE
ncbi:response regulator [Butyrivibrio sp. NC3005]|uniref:response regulator n=1 Tax=Butyrivibrio sp. NC3005 TaxID=1280685 RepID=UPI000409B2A5|nr:response regulator [Butyrivibrio sp. NC3005]